MHIMREEAQGAKGAGSLYVNRGGTSHRAANNDNVRKIVPKIVPELRVVFGRK